MMKHHVAVPVPGGTASLLDFPSEAPANMTLAASETWPVGRLFWYVLVWCWSVVVVSQ